MEGKRLKVNTLDGMMLVGSGGLNIVSRVRDTPRGEEGAIIGISASMDTTLSFDIGIHQEATILLALLAPLNGQNRQKSGDLLFPGE